MTAATASTDRIPVLYIAGAGRSGSTLLDMIFGQIEGFCAMGEVSSIWKDGFADNRLCGCGQPFRDCPLWSAIVAEGLGPDFDGPATRRLARSVDRWKLVYRHLIPFGQGDFLRRSKTYTNTLVSMFRAALNQTHASVIVESSKPSGHGFLLAADPRVDLHVVHLIRDPMAVAFSWRRVVRNPAGHEEPFYMDRKSTFRTALLWDVRNLCAHWYGHHAASYTKVRYEDFVARPKQNIERILEAMGQGERSLDFISDNAVELAPQHLMGSNPSKFRHGHVEIRMDAEWKRALSLKDKALVSALTWPLAASYGYLRL
jgi:hypothetical protein